MPDTPATATRRLAEAVAAHRAELGDRARVAFVLHPGGAAGAYQAGAIEALAEHGVKADLLVGTSIGAFNGLGVLLEAVSPHPRGVWPSSRLGRVWRHMSHRQQGSALLLDKPCLVGYATGRPGWSQGLLANVAGHLLHLKDELAALHDGLFSTERLRSFTLATVARALGHEGDADAAGRRLVEAWAPGHPTLIAVTTAVATHQAVPFVLGDPAVAERLHGCGRPVRMLGHGALTGAAVLDALVASASIPGVFPPVKLPEDGPAGAEGWHVDGAIANAEPLHLAIDAGATLIISLGLESAHDGTPYVPDAGTHFAIAAAESFMTVQDRYQALDARNLARTNRLAAEGHAPGKRVVPLVALAPPRRAIGLLDFDGRFVEGELVLSLFDWYMAGYGDAGGINALAWLAYQRGHERHGDTLWALAPRPAGRFRNATFLESEASPQRRAT